MDPTGRDYMFVSGVGDDKKGQEGWDVIVKWLKYMGALENEKVYFFEWPDSNLAPWENLSFLELHGTTAGAVAALDKQMKANNLTDIKLVGHSKGGSLVLEYLKQLSEDSSRFSEGVTSELRRAVVLDAPGGDSMRILSRAAGTSPSSTYNGTMENLREQGLSVDVHMVQNMADPIMSDPINGIPYHYFSCDASQGGFNWNPLTNHGYVMQHRVWGGAVAALVRTGIWIGATR